MEPRGRVWGGGGGEEEPRKVVKPANGTKIVIKRSLVAALGDGTSAKGEGKKENGAERKEDGEVDDKGDVAVDGVDQVA